MFYWGHLLQKNFLCLLGIGVCHSTNRENMLQHNCQQVIATLLPFRSLTLEVFTQAALALNRPSTATAVAAVSLEMHQVVASSEGSLKEMLQCDYFRRVGFVVLFLLDLLSICICFLNLHCICFLQFWSQTSKLICYTLKTLGGNRFMEMSGGCKALHRCAFLFLPFSFLIDDLEKRCYRVWAKSVRSGLPLVVPSLPGSQHAAFWVLVSFAPVPSASKSLDLGPRWWMYDYYYNC